MELKEAVLKVLGDASEQEIYHLLTMYYQQHCECPTAVHSKCGRADWARGYTPEAFCPEAWLKSAGEIKLEREVHNVTT